MGYNALEILTPTMSNKSKVEGLVSALKHRILSGEFGNDGRLPSFRNLASEYETTQETMNKTIHALQAEGLLTSFGVKGVFINLPPVRILGEIPDFFKYLKEQYPDSTEEYIEIPSIIAGPIDVLQAMGLQNNSMLMKRFKRQKTDDVVFRIEETFYPENLLTNEIKEKILKDVSYVPLNDIKAEFKLTASNINDRILGRLPSVFEQKLLKIVRTNPVIDIKRTTFQKDKKTVICYEHLIFNANLFYLSYDNEVDSRG